MSIEGCNGDEKCQTLGCLVLIPDLGQAVCENVLCMSTSSDKLGVFQT